MHDKLLLETCAREFERGIERLFETAPRIPGTGMAETPVIGGRFLTWADHSFLLPQVYRALIAREQFHQDAPGWPTLPLHEQDIEAAIENDDDPRCRLLGYYGYSLAGADWDYDGHPRFSTFASGLLAYQHTPIEVRTDPQLLREYPPLPLAGLTDGNLYWRSPERIAEDRQRSAWVYEMDARREEGATMQAFDEWVREQVPMFVGCC